MFQQAAQHFVLKVYGTAFNNYIVINEAKFDQISNKIELYYIRRIT